jgi:3-oxoacyl-[acyl-carrier protein] reductase
MINLANQNAVVVGGSRGIGAATAVMLAQAGANVAILYSRRQDSAENVLSRVKALGRRGIALLLMIDDFASCQKAVAEVIRKFRSIDILVNSAGIWEYGEIDRMTPIEWRRTIEVNLTGTFNICRSVIPFMKKRKYGRIINVSSTAAQRGEPYHSHYAASKGGIIAFTKSLGPELIKNGIWVNCVAPGWVETDMISSVLKNPKEKRSVLQTIPRGKIASPEEIAGPIVFLASRLADNIVGEVVNVNGGSVLCG